MGSGTGAGSIPNSGASPVAARPVWLLDIDGVVNVLAAGPVPHSWPPPAWLQLVVQANPPGLGPARFPIFTARPVLEFLHHVHRTGAAEIVWHSTWREAAVTALAPALGLPPFPISVAPEWEQRHPAGWWKLGAAQRVVEAGRRLVWTDDDFVRYERLIEPIAQRRDTLLIGPRPDVGLTAVDLDRIAAFLQLR